MKLSTSRVLTQRPIRYTSKFCYQVNHHGSCKEIVFENENFLCSKGHRGSFADFDSTLDIKEVVLDSFSTHKEELDIQTPAHSQALIDEKFIFQTHNIASDSPAAKAKSWKLSPLELIELSLIDDMDTTHNLSRNPNVPEEALANIIEKSNLPLEIWVNVASHKNLNSALAKKIFYSASSHIKVIEAILRRASCPTELLIEALQNYDNQIIFKAVVANKSFSTLMAIYEKGAKTYKLNEFLVDALCDLRKNPDFWLNASTENKMKLLVVIVRCVLGTIQENLNKRYIMQHRDEISCLFNDARYTEYINLLYAI
jgi:hypothetical protein